MKKTVLLVIGLIIAGTFAYFAGYYLYVTNRPQVEIEEPVALQRAISETNENETENAQEYYLAKIEQKMLVIYKMPEESLYDSLETNNLQFQEKDYSKLLEGMVFENLTEVFEFLENCMS